MSSTNADVDMGKLEIAMSALGRETPNKFTRIDMPGQSPYPVNLRKEAVPLAKELDARPPRKKRVRDDDDDELPAAKAAR
ncbi:hypothetical protein HKX48_006692 [Thoreauomyces humboldtii]|nr:hypothetical protein HKX48_006692 [Thoreauomyces humboldtii]